MTKEQKTVVVLSSHTKSLFWYRLDMMREFLRRGCRVYAFANEPEKDWADKFAAYGIVYRQILVNRTGMNPFLDRKTEASIRENLQDVKPDCVFTYHAKTIIYGAMAANRLGITEVYPMIAGVGSVFLADSLKKKLLRAGVVMLYRRALRKCPAVFFQNEDDEALFRSNGIVKKQAVVRVHGSGVNTELFSVMPLPAQTTFLCTSRLIRDKGVYEYLMACRKLKAVCPEAKCLLVGPFDSNPSALKPEELQPFLDEGSVVYFGEQEDVRPYLAQSSVFVLPSYREGTPKVNLEAMACGRAVITTDAPGCRETVRDGENGFLVPVRDADAVCEKMRWFLEHPDSIQKMGSAGRKLAEEIFDVKKVNAAICEAMKIRPVDG